MRETVVKPIGLVTQPNKYGVYPPGALLRADNVVMREPGKLTQMQLRSSLLPSPSSTLRIEKMHSTAEQLLLFEHDLITTNAWETHWLDAAGNDNTAPFIDPLVGPFPSFNDVTVKEHRSISSILFRSRSIFNSDQGILATDYTAPSTADERTIRYAGMVQPLLHMTLLSGPTGLASGDIANFAAVLVRKYADGYTLISEPSPITGLYNNTGGDRGGQAQVIWSSPGGAERSGVREDDIIELYRTVGTPFVTDATDPGNTLYLVATHVITAAEITAGFALVLDSSTPDGLGQELYTNPGQEAGAAPRRRPPAAMSITQYKGFAFYSNLTYPAQWKAGWPGGIGFLDLPAERAYGVGARILTGTFAVGSPTITAISAADMVGIVDGQRLPSMPGTGLPQTIISHTANSITVDANSVIAGPQVFSVEDVLEIDGNEYAFSSLPDLIQKLGTENPGPDFYSVVTEQNLRAQGIASTEPQADQRMLLEPARYVQGSITIRATNGQNYDPPVPEIDEAVQTFEPTREPNLTTWSWADQPEAVSPGNNTAVGYGEIQASIATRDAIWFLASDGLYRLTGYGTRSSGIEANFRVDLLDRTVAIARPDALTVLRDMVYSHTNRGFVEINDAGVRELSAGVIGDILPGARLDAADVENQYFMAADDDNDEVWLGWTSSGVTTYFIYREPVEAFTSYVAADTSTALIYFEALQGLALAVDDDAVDYFTPDPDFAFAENATVDYQPVSAGDPLTAKQWIDCALIMDLASAGLVNINARFNGTDIGGGFTIAKKNDSRLNVGVPRRAPAVAHTLSPGVHMSDNDSHRGQFFGLSLRFEVLTDQQLYRP